MVKSPKVGRADVEAMTSTISIVITRAIETDFSPELLASPLDNSPTVVMQHTTTLIEQAVGDDVNAITVPLLSQVLDLLNLLLS